MKGMNKVKLEGMSLNALTRQKNLVVKELEKKGSPVLSHYFFDIVAVMDSKKRREEPTPIQPAEGRFAFALA